MSSARRKVHRSAPPSGMAVCSTGAGALLSTGRVARAPRPEGADLAARLAVAAHLALWASVPWCSSSPSASASGRHRPRLPLIPWMAPGWIACSRRSIAGVLTNSIEQSLVFVVALTALANDARRTHQLRLLPIPDRPSFRDRGAVAFWVGYRIRPEYPRRGECDHIQRPTSSRCSWALLLEMARWMGGRNPPCSMESLDEDNLHRVGGFYATWFTSGARRRAPEARVRAPSARCARRRGSPGLRLRRLAMFWKAVARAIEAARLAARGSLAVLSSTIPAARPGRPRVIQHLGAPGAGPRPRPRRACGSTRQEPELSRWALGQPP